jgi:hypothetical protein
VNFGAEKNKGFMRPSLLAAIQYSAGSGSVASTSTTFTLYEADFLAGFKFFMFPTGSIQPFVGADAVIGTGILKLPAIVETTDANTLGFSYGFVLSTGVNISKTRIQGQYWYLSSTMGGSTSFNLGGFRFAVSLVF